MYAAVVGRGESPAECCYRDHVTQVKPRVLVIDDEPDSVGLLLRYLADSDLDVRVALDGADGLEKAETGRPDLVLLDVSMPGMDGFAVCQQLRAKAWARGLPILLLSARDDLSVKLRGFALGCVDYITKPFSQEEVLARINVHLQLRERIVRAEVLASARALADLGEQAAPEMRLFARAQALLKETLSEGPRLDTLARRLGLSPRRLSDLFRRQVGVTVSEYLLELRLETARHLLASSGLQVQLIADRVGYEQPGDFTRAFRRRFGVSPREYRAACRSAAPAAGASVTASS
jgi:YesN/AraC family two-component response regulator